MFAQPNGRPIDPKADHQAWKDLLGAAGVREARLHDARHTAATMLQMLNVGTRAVMDMMGWSSSSMAARYQHVTNDLRHDIADSLGVLVWGATENPRSEESNGRIDLPMHRSVPDSRDGQGYGVGMTLIEAAVWGLFGGFAVEGLDLYGAVRRHGCWPWRVRGPREVGAAGYFVTELFRLVIGGGLACALAESSQVTTAVGAVAVGIAPPLIVERLTRAIPLTDSVPGTGTVTADKWLPTAPGSELNGQRTPVEEQRVRADEAEVAPQSDQPGRVGE